MATDIVGIKNTIQSIFNTNNTTTSSIDLSGTMSKRVLSVLTLNPEKINILGDIYPYVTIWTDKKSIVAAEMARDQVTARREAGLLLNIAGAVWNQNFQSDLTNDPADDDLELLMENVETILRNNPTLNGGVTWQFPTETDYFSMPIDEEAHLRVARLQLSCKIFY